MPYLKIQTNLNIDSSEATALAQKASKTVSELLGKAERYVMVALEDGTSMVFAGSNAPLAYLELKSIGLPPERTKSFSQALCSFIQNELSIPPERIYIEFDDAPRNMWGWNGDTFER